MVIWPFENSYDVSIINKQNSGYYTYIPGFRNREANNWNSNPVYFKTTEEAFQYFLENYVDIRICFQRKFLKSIVVQ